MNFEFKLKPFNSLKFRILFYFFIPLTLSFILILYFLNTVISESLEDELGKKLLSVAKIACANLNPDHIPFLGKFSLTLTKKYNSLLLKIKKAADIERITIVDNKLNIILDTEGNTGKYYLGELDLKELKEAFAGRPDISILYKGYDNKPYKSVYVPIFSKNKDKVIAVLGAEASADFLQTVTHLENILIFTGVLTALLTLFVAWILIRSIIKPLDKINKAAIEFGKGNTAKRIDSIPRNEFGYTAIVFNKMADSIVEKENLLQQLYKDEKERAELYRNFNDFVLASIPTGIISFDKEKKVLTFNKGMKEIFEIQESSQGKNIENLFSKYEDLLKIINSSDLKVQTEIRIVTPSNKSKIISINKLPVYNNNSELIAECIFAYDMTEKVKLLTEVEKKERLAALGQLSAGIAHEIRNPLGAIKGFAEILKEKVEKNNKSLIENILIEVDTLNQFITNFLLFASSKRFKFELVNISHLLEETINFMKPSFEKSGKKLHVDIEADLITTGSSTMLKRAFINLMINSIEKPSEFVKIEALKENRNILIKFSDNGGIIDEKIMKHIFEPFFTTKEKGTGLGLAIVNTIIKNHGGKIFPKNKNKSVAIFEILLPVKGVNKT